jgi:hypothetical protein
VKSFPKILLHIVSSAAGRTKNVGGWLSDRLGQEADGRTNCPPRPRCGTAGRGLRYATVKYCTRKKLSICSRCGCDGIFSIGLVSLLRGTSLLYPCPLLSKYRLRGSLSRRATRRTRVGSWILVPGFVVLRGVFTQLVPCSLAGLAL